VIEVIAKISWKKNKMKLKNITRRDFLDVKPNIYTWKTVRDVWGAKEK